MAIGTIAEQGGRALLSLPARAVTVTEGTKAGVMWRKNPIPRAWKTADGQWGKGSNHGQVCIVPRLRRRCVV